MSRNRVAKHIGPDLPVFRMSASTEAPFVYAFAALLGVGSAVLLFVPLIRYLRDVAAGRSAFAVAIVGVVGLSLAALFGSTISAWNETSFLPVAAMTAALRIASPTLLYRGIRSRFESRRTWPIIRVAVAVLFLAFAVLLAYNLYHVVTGQELPWVASLSEQLAMALGASVLILRTMFRFRPQFTGELWPLWFSATSFAVAFVLVAPYAFPTFAMAYLMSGLIGWIVGMGVLRFTD